MAAQDRWILARNMASLARPSAGDLDLHQEAERSMSASVTFRG